MFREVQLVMAVLGVLSVGAVVHGQTPGLPQPGDLQRQVEPERPLDLPDLRTAPPRLRAPTEPTPGVDVVTVLRWQFSGNTVISSQELARRLEPFTRRGLSFDNLEEAALVVEQTYDEAGYLASVTLPAQDITEGVVRMDILEARFGEVRMDPGGQSRVRRPWITGVIEGQQERGEVLDFNRLDRALLLADDLPGVNVEGALEAGSGVGLTDLALTTVAQPAAAFDLSFDNTNSRSVGQYRVNASALAVSPLGWSETWSFQGLRSEGSVFGRANVGFPLGLGGLRGNVYVSRMDYRVISAELKALDLRGGSDSVGTDLRYPLVRSRPFNLYTELQVEQRGYDSRVSEEAQSDYQIESLQWGFSGNVFDDFAGGGASSFSLRIVNGRLDEGAIEVDPQVARRYSKLTYSLSRQQVLSERMSLSAAVQGQHSWDAVLDSSENFQLGGATAVRAYPGGEASGPKGVLANADVQWRLSDQLLMTVFTDWGRISGRREDQGGPEAYSLSGGGLTATWGAPAGFTVQATLARRFGDNPNPQENGRDGDGTLREQRLWLTISRSF